MPSSPLVSPAARPPAVLPSECSKCVSAHGQHSYAQLSLRTVRSCGGKEQKTYPTVMDAPCARVLHQVNNCSDASLAGPASQQTQSSFQALATLSVGMHRNVAPAPKTFGSSSRRRGNLGDVNERPSEAIPHGGPCLVLPEISVDSDASLPRDASPNMQKIFSNWRPSVSSLANTSADAVDSPICSPRRSGRENASSSPVRRPDSPLSNSI
eukprot:GHVT01047730.1.p1 GENE.GHVT01047730.1~~GHVT01047730.1.p1  ORF type:complete len:211 (-),score=18.09 GHVT01047730.1:32-664(-)